MMRNTIILAGLVVAATCLAQEAAQYKDVPSETRWCDPAGTWYGGSDMTMPYHLSIIPSGIGRYSVRFQQAIDYAALGINGVTDWTGEMAMIFGQKFNLHITAFYVLAPASPSGSATLEMDAVRSTMEFANNCNVLRHTINAYIGYVPWTEEKVPFITSPDVNVLDLIGVTTFTETYYRVPTACPKCPFAGTAKTAVQDKATRGHRR